MFFLRAVYTMAIIFNTSSIFAESPKVIVIGAGLAGLTTAYRLHKAGMDVEVYEARSRVGGRVFTVNVCGHPEELGAQNITDGGEAENTHRLINECQLELSGFQVSLNQFYFAGEKLIPVRELLDHHQFNPQKLKNTLNELVPKSRNMKDILHGILDQNDPLYKVVAVKLAAYEGGTIEKLSLHYTETLFHMLLGGICSVHQGKEKEESQLNLLSIKGGNALLPEKLAETLGSRLHLNRPLIRISKDASHSFILTFRDGQQVKADILVMAVPCSVYTDIVFEDQVIELERLNAIKNVQYGMNAKILIPFSTAPSKRMGLINDRMVSFLNAESSLLTLYYIGESSLFSSTTILNAYSQDRSMVEMGFGAACPPFAAPLIAEDRAFLVYQGPVGYSWPSAPYVKGSYSYIATGQETLLKALHEENGELVKTLFAPIDQRLYFAGEHTSILLDVPGTMEAACESGERTARMILQTCQ